MYSAPVNDVQLDILHKIKSKNYMRGNRNVSITMHIFFNAASLVFSNKIFVNSFKTFQREMY